MHIRKILKKKKISRFSLALLKNILIHIKNLRNFFLIVIKLYENSKKLYEELKKKFIR